MCLPYDSYHFNTKSTKGFASCCPRWFNANISLIWILSLNMLHKLIDVFITYIHFMLKKYHRWRLLLFLWQRTFYLNCRSLCARKSNGYSHLPSGTVVIGHIFVSSILWNEQSTAVNKLLCGRFHMEIFVFLCIVSSFIYLGQINFYERHLCERIFHIETIVWVRAIMVLLSLCKCVCMVQLCLGMNASCQPQRCPSVVCPPVYFDSTPPLSYPSSYWSTTRHCVLCGGQRIFLNS